MKLINLLGNYLLLPLIFFGTSLYSLSDQYRWEEIGRTYSSNYQDAALTSPVNGATNVSVNTSISWTRVDGVDGYIISLGTSPGSRDLVADQMVGLTPAFRPAIGLPGNTTIYVSISLYFSDGPNILCPEQSFTTEAITVPPSCSILAVPVGGDVDVPADRALEWAPALFAEGYRISIGTAPGLNDIVNNLDVGNVLAYTPPGGLPERTTIYVLIHPYNSIASNTNCREESFTTGIISLLPSCTNLMSPGNGTSEIPLNATVSWNPVANATGYRIMLGSSEFDDDLLPNTDLGNVTSISSLNLIPNTTYFITITPYNDEGSAVDCLSESFTTVFSCGPYTDPNSNEEINLAPELDFPERVSLCEGSIPFTANAQTAADGYRWFEIREDGAEILVSEESDFDIFQEGKYRIEVFNFFEEFNAECAASQEFIAVTSESPMVNNIDLQFTATGAIVTLDVSGNGDYEYALNDANGPYQDNPVFAIDIDESNYIYIRDRNGCGITERFINTAIPNFFTPNGDSYNDYWQIPGGQIDGESIAAITIFDRFGKVVKKVNPHGQGWDGTYQGNPMPSNDYWYTIELENGKTYKGHFALIRR